MTGAHSPRAAPAGRPAGGWGAHPAVAAIGVLLIVAGTVWALVSYGDRDQLVAVVVAVVGLFPLLCGLGWRHRLTVDDTGLLLRGLFGARRVPWAQVHSIEAVTRTRYGISGTTLEVDLDDEGLIVLSRLELGADPTGVARALVAARPH